MAGELMCRCRKRLPSGFELDAALRIPLAEAPVTVLFGPSGSGKTTLLRLLAGLERPDEGCITFSNAGLADAAWCDTARGTWLAPQKRRAAFLFQDYALFPHLTVAENVAYGASPQAARKLLDTFGLAEFADRLPGAISGGQQQRVALARALAARPALLLLDEPLSALDALTRLRVRHDLRRLLVASGVPAIVVTHDRMEAIALGDWMAVMIDGRIRQAGPVQEVFRHPADARVAESVGVENVLPARIVSRERGLLTLEVGSAHLACIDAVYRTEAVYRIDAVYHIDAVYSEASGDTGQVFACIRAEDVALTRDLAQTSSARNRVAGRVQSVILEGPLARVELDCGFPLVAVVTAQSAGELQLNPGDAVCAIVKATAVHVAT
jgi:molybdate transport system ATP-binding protein